MKKQTQHHKNVSVLHAEMITVEQLIQKGYMYMSQYISTPNIIFEMLFFFSQGVERFLKICTRCCINRFDNIHSINDLHTKLWENIGDKSTYHMPPLLIDFFDILSKFAIDGRYSNLSVLK
jgi:hypothetical protein